MAENTDEAFAMLLLENSFNRWGDLFELAYKSGDPDEKVNSEVETLYTPVGLDYKDRAIKTGERGWSKRGIIRFNELVDMVRRDRISNPTFFTEWLSSYNKNGGNKKKRRHAFDDSVLPMDDLFGNDVVENCQSNEEQENDGNSEEANGDNKESACDGDNEENDEENGDSTETGKETVKDGDNDDNEETGNGEVDDNVT